MAVLLLACGAESDSPEEGDEIEEIEQAFGESTCASTTPDFSCNLSGPGQQSCGETSGSPYGHSTCSNAFIGTYTFNSEGGVSIEATGTRAGGAFPCDSAWVVAKLYVRMGGLWKPTSHANNGVVFYGSGDPAQGCFAPSVRFTDLPAQNYKIVAQAGIIYSYQPVSIRGFGPYVPKIVINGLTSLEGSLSTHSLTSGQHAEGNDATGLPATWPTLSTARGRVTMKYAVGCALAADRTVTLYDTSGNAYAFTGEVGVAPEWETEACGERCQESVSACMLARMNLTGTHTAISLNGPNHALGWSQNANYPRQEAAYFGNVFSSPPVAYACKGSGADLRPISGRLCIGQRDCPYVNAFQNGGKCDAGCTAHPSGTGYSACTVGGRTFSYPATAWTH